MVLVLACRPGGVGNGSPLTPEWPGLAAERCGPWAELTSPGPACLATEFSFVRPAGDSGLKNRASSSGMTFPCDTWRVSDSPRNGAAALRPQGHRAAAAIFRPKSFTDKWCIGKESALSQRMERQVRPNTPPPRAFAGILQMLPGVHCQNPVAWSQRSTWVSQGRGPSSSQGLRFLLRPLEHVENGGLSGTPYRRRRSRCSGFTSDCF